MPPGSGPVDERRVLGEREERLRDPVFDRDELPRGLKGQRSLEAT